QERLRDREYRLPPRVSCLEMADRVRRFTERIRPVDDGLHLAVLDQLLERRQVRRTGLRNERPDALARETRHDGRREPRNDRAGYKYERSVLLERSAQPTERGVLDVVDDEVVPAATVCEVLSRVVHHLVGAKRTHEFDVARAAHTRDVRTERLRELHRKRADATRSAVDQDPLTCLDVPAVTQSLQRGLSRDRNRRGLLKGDVHRLRDDRLARTDVFGEGAVAAAEDLVAGRQVRPLRTDPLHDAREVDPEDRLLRAAQPEQRANEIRLASHVVPVVWVHR